MFHCGAGEGEHCLHLVGDVEFARIYARALRGGHYYLVVGLHLHRSEVGGGLYQAFEVAAHGDHSVRCAVEREDEVAGGLGVMVKSGLSTLSRVIFSVVSRPLYSRSMSATY